MRLFLTVLPLLTTILAAPGEPCISDSGEPAARLRPLVRTTDWYAAPPTAPATPSTAPAGGAAKYGPYDAPAIPEVGSCKAQTVAGAKKVVEAFPGRIWSAGCYREGECRDGSEHPCGRAIDFMCSDETGLGSTGCTDIAEWVMHHTSELNVYYVIWGQRIWNGGRDKVGPWSGWRTMEDRKSITQNHCFNEV
ncbi:hypothetical protein A1Q2_04376 [Trichosporon asahii var. asahii CBS 8904]|uniref:ARB-07466-like C-terminal domain-containing protein n=1 Tax=Trichosporon asahii var. asahii (strain CBS 8904) TaxID=1220162 RepID=K1VWU4_TRIAC|nr:hypothetical protein A1Q2_04376 [Trichosporon asahii var. asahii CBS 8904]